MLCTRLTNARFLTMDPDHPVAHDLGIWRGRTVGLDEAVTSLPAREVIDLQGATVPVAVATVLVAAAIVLGT